MLKISKDKSYFRNIFANQFKLFNMQMQFTPSSIPMKFNIPSATCWDQNQDLETRSCSPPIYVAKVALSTILGDNRSKFKCK